MANSQQHYTGLSLTIMDLYRLNCHVVIKVGDSVVPERVYDVAQTVVVVSIPKGHLRYIDEGARRIAYVVKEI